MRLQHEHLVGAELVGDAVGVGPIELPALLRVLERDIQIETPCCTVCQPKIGDAAFELQIERRCLANDARERGRSALERRLNGIGQQEYAWRWR